MNCRHFPTQQPNNVFLAQGAGVLSCWKMKMSPSEPIFYPFQQPVKMLFIPVFPRNNSSRLITFLAVYTFSR